MLKKQITKLFAVAALVVSGPALAEAPRTLSNGRPACGNTNSKGGDDDCEMTQRETQLGARARQAAQRKRIAAARTAKPAATRIVIAPARTPGAPVDRLAISTTPVIAPAPAMVRTLPNGSPACGNVASKGPRRACETTVLK